MASEMENVNEVLIEELTTTKGRKKAASEGKDRGRARRWTEPEIDQLINLLEEKDCLWDVNKKDYHVRNKCERAFEEMRDILDIDVAESYFVFSSKDPTCCDLLRTFAHIR